MELCCNNIVKSRMKKVKVIGVTLLAVLKNHIWKKSVFGMVCFRNVLCFFVGKVAGPGSFMFKYQSCFLFEAFIDESAAFATHVEERIARQTLYVLRNGKESGREL